MSNLAKPIKLDPEFAAAYSDSQGAVAEVDSHEDDFQIFQRMAEDNRRKGIDRKQFAPGSFDQIEADVTNICKLGFDFLTRPIKE